MADQDLLREQSWKAGNLLRIIHHLPAGNERVCYEAIVRADTQLVVDCLVLGGGMSDLWCRVVGGMFDLW